ADGNATITSCGERVLAAGDATFQLREQIRQQLTLEQPPWGATLLQGRQAFARYVQRDVLQCFEEAELLDSYDTGAVECCDEIAACYRAHRDALLTEIGRQGERLTLDYEEHRTNKRARWIAIEYTGAGYDVLSQVSREDPNPLFVEVKTSNQPWDRAEVYLTYNEWEVLSVASHAVVHLWCINSNDNRHAVIPIQEIGQHVPEDRGDGRWQTVRIPFATWQPRT
ncbi:MAG: protein NO VEIN domain-containing protein, partial [Pseudomonadales bacterium]